MIKEGFAAIISLLVISAVVLSIAVSTSLLGIDAAKVSSESKYSDQSLVIAKSCTEEAMIRLKRTSQDSYTGGNLNVGNGSCIINIVVITPETEYTVNVTAQVVQNSADYTKKITAGVTKAKNAVIQTSWQEI